MGAMLSLVVGLNLSGSFRAPQAAGDRLAASPCYSLSVAQKKRGARERKGRGKMAKAYWMTFYHSIRNPDALAEYAKLAASAIEAGGGRFLVRGMPAEIHEAGKKERVVVIEFPSLAQAKSTHDSAGYQAALKVLGDAAVRDMRFVEGLG